MSVPWKTTDEKGNVKWFKAFDLHREDGPAVEYPDGTTCWYLNGKPHRGGGLPAFEFSNRRQEWFVEGKRHRDDGTALISADGSKYWYRNNQQHRDGGPAVEMADGTKIWIVNGKRHREDGPAFIAPDGSETWWQNGKELDREQVAALRAKIQRQEKERHRRLLAEEVVTPFRGTVRAVAAPEKAVFKKHARKKLSEMRV